MFKKSLAVVLSAAMALALIGCGGTSKTDTGEIKLGEYKGLVVYHDDIEVTDEAYQQTVDYFLNQDATTEMVKKGKVKADSTVTVDYSGEIEVNGKKVKFEGGQGKDQNINMATDGQRYIENFVSVLKGHKVGDKFTKKLKFPETYGNTTKIDGKEIKLDGKDVWFTYTIKGLQITKTPELTDEYVTKKFGTYGVKDLKSFEEYVKTEMRTANIMQKIWTKFLDSCEVVSYNNNEKESLQTVYEENFKMQLQQQYQVDLANYLEACSMSEEEWKKEVKSQVEDSLKQKMAIRAIADKEKLVPTAADYKTEAETLAEQNSVSVKELESQYGKSEVEYAIMSQRVQKFIADNVKVKEGSEPTTEAPTTEAETKAK